MNGRELFQLIDGAGEKYLSYGFRQLGRTDYRKLASELVVTAEIYDMGTPLGAFGQYSMLLSDSRDPATMRSRSASFGGGGFLGTNQLVFWKGQYLVQLNLSDDSGEQDETALGSAAREVLPGLATRLDAVIPGEVAAPSSGSMLPRDGLVWGGATYLTNELFGVGQTGPGWVGHYESPGGERYRLAVLTRASEAEAHATFLRFRVTDASSVSGIGAEAFSSASLNAARSGPHVVVVAGPLPDTLPTLSPGGRLEQLRSCVAALQH